MSASGIDAVVERLGIKVDPNAAKGEALGILAQLRQDVTSTDAAGMAEAVADVLRSSGAISALAGLRRIAPDDWRAALVELRGVRGMAGHVRELERAVKDAAKTGLRVVGEGERVRPDCVPEGYRVPDGYIVTPTGILRQVGEALELCAHGPVYVTGRMVDVDTGKHSLRLAWPGAASGAWHEAIVPASTAADARSLVTLRDDGCPVSSPVAGGLARYLGESEALNAHVLPHERASGRCGWVAGGFLAGTRWLGDEAAPVRLRADGGMEAIAAEVGPAGTWEGYVEALMLARRYPYPWLATIGPIASLLLDVVGERLGFLVDFSGDTSTGKSITLETWLSVWGPPRGRAFLTWEATRVAIEGAAYMRGALGLGIDDTKHAQDDPRKVADIIYSYANGRTKPRGAPPSGSSPVAMRMGAEWLGGAVITGEQRATAFTEDGGTRARVLAFEGLPFFEKSAAAGELADEIAYRLSENYGHLGPRCVEWLLRDGNREWVKAQHAVQLAEVVPKLRGYSAVAGRLGRVVALFRVAWLVMEEVGMPAPECDLWSVLEAVAIAGGSDSDRPRAALDRLYSLCGARTGAFLDRTDGLNIEMERMPPGGWLGLWDRTTPGWEHIDVFEAQMPVLLKAIGVEDITATIKAWADRGWLATNHGNRYRLKHNGRRQVAYRLLRSALDPD